MLGERKLFSAVNNLKELEEFLSHNS